MSWKVFAGIALFLVSSRTVAGGMGDAFSQGQALGSTGVSSTQANITAGQGTGVVPNYTGAAPESSYFAGGQGALFGPATGKVSNCATSPQATTAYAQQDCDAVNFLARNPSIRPQIDVGKNDPLVTGATTILANPGNYAGGTDGTYSDCSTATVNQPAQFTTEVCNQYSTFTENTCNKLLNVTVSQVQSCTPGTYYSQSFNWYWGMDGIVGAAYCEYRADGKVVVAFDGRGGQGSCTPGGWARAALSPGQTYSQMVQPHWHGSCTTFSMTAKLNWCSGDTCQATVGAAGPASCPSGQINGGNNALGDCYRDGFSWICAPNGQRADPTMCYKSSATGLNFIEIRCWADGCSYDYKGTYTLVGPGTPSIGTPSVTFSFLRPHLTSTVNKSWNNQCSGLEALAK